MSKYSIFFLMPILALSCATKTANWYDDVTSLMAEGEFTQADSILAQLSPEIKDANVYKIDSLQAIMKRIRYDFSISEDSGRNLVRERIPGITDGRIDTMIEKRYIETMTLDGERRWFRKAIRNLFLLDPELKTPLSEDPSTPQYRSALDEIIAAPVDDAHCNHWTHVVVNFTLSVDSNAVPEGEEIRAWLPVPIETSRQRNVKILATSDPATPSEGSVHNTVYMSKPAVNGQPTVFTIDIEYDVAAQYFPKEYLLANLKPYDKEKDDYKNFTGSDARHIKITPEMTELAKKIVGDETNPVEQAGMIFDWIVERFPWAGARDYGTIDNIPQYVLDNGHGDCGQVALLYITLTRSLGIPSRWESGWVVEPWGTGWHDWAETYFEGIGWVPTDVSIGRRFPDFFKTSTDMFRFATNTGYGGMLSPAKKYIRTEPIDFQAGEVEWKGGNIEMTDFDSQLTVKSYEPIKE